ncbi:MAG: hypothetical protein WC459_02995 [Patescibacteria group bacterium]
MKKALLLLIAVATMALIARAVPAKAQTTLVSGDLIKIAGNSAVYYYGASGKRYVFPNEKTYKSWYANFSGVKTITATELAAIQIGGNVTYRPGVKMIKIQSDPKVYAISKGSTLRWIQTEALAVSLYGSDWNKKIDDLSDAFFTNYKTGSTITAASNYNPTDEMNGATTINMDLSLTGSSS